MPAAHRSMRGDASYASTNQEMEDVFFEWITTNQESILLSITSTILLKKNSYANCCKPNDAFLVDHIQDQAHTKRSGVDTLVDSVVDVIYAQV